MEACTFSDLLTNAVKATQVVALSKAWVCRHLLPGIMGLNPAGGNGCLSLVSVVCCQIEVCATSRSLVQSSPTHCGVTGCDLETSRMRRPTRAVEPWRGGNAIMLSGFLYVRQY